MFVLNVLSEPIMMNLISHFCVLFCALHFVLSTPILYDWPVIHEKLGKSCQFPFPPFMLELTNGIKQESISLPAPSGAHDTYITNCRLLEWTCEMNRTWAHPLYPNKIYSIPDQIESIGYDPIPQNTTVVTFTDEMYTDPYQAFVLRSALTGLEPFGEDYGSFVRSKQHARFSELLDGSKFVIERIGYLGMIHVKVNTTALMVGLELQEKIWKDTRWFGRITHSLRGPDYKDILDKCGSHYVEKAEFSSLLMQIAIINSTYLVNNSLQQVEKNLMSHMKRYTDDDLRKKPDPPLLDEEFKRNSQVVFCGQTGVQPHASVGLKESIFLGCNESVSIIGYDRWFPYAMNNPLLVEAKLAPIENLFEADRHLYEYLKKGRLSQNLKNYYDDRRAAQLFTKSNMTLPEFETFDENIRAVINQWSWPLYHNNSKKYFEKLQTAYNELASIDAKFQLRQKKAKLQKFEAGIFRCKSYFVKNYSYSNQNVTQTMDLLRLRLQTYQNETDRQLGLSESEFVPANSFRLARKIEGFLNEESYTQVDFCLPEDDCCHYDRFAPYQLYVHNISESAQIREQVKDVPCLGDDYEHNLFIVSLWQFLKKDHGDLSKFDRC